MLVHRLFCKFHSSKLHFWDCGGTQSQNTDSFPSYFKPGKADPTNTHHRTFGREQPFIKDAFGGLPYFQTKPYCQINQAENSTMSANDWLLPCLLPRKCHLPRILGIGPLPKQSNPENSQQVRAGESNPYVENHIHSQYVGNISSCRGLAISFYLDIQKTPFMVKPCHTKDVRISSTNVIYGDGSKHSTTYILTIFGAINTN